MCEETHPGTQKLVQNIHKHIDINRIHETLIYFYIIKIDPTVLDFKNNLMKVGDSK